MRSKSIFFLFIFFLIGIVFLVSLLIFEKISQASPGSCPACPPFKCLPCLAPPPVPGEDCTNGIDDDGDGCVDGVDSDCGGIETNGSDKIDNDCDGLIDGNDPDCVPPCIIPGRECSTNLMLVLDVSSSMGTDCGPSQDRAKDFIDKFMEKPELQNWAGVVHFGYKYSDGSSKYWTKLSQELTSDKEAVKNSISQNCVDHTPTESGVVMATEELLEEGAKSTSVDVPKVMIVFTDGAPNGCASTDCYCRTAGDMECKTTDDCASAACDSPVISGYTAVQSDAINAANNARSPGNDIRVFVIGYGAATTQASFRTFNRAVANDDCSTSPFAPDCYWEAPTIDDLPTIYNAIFLVIADRDGDGFVDVKCGGDDQDDSLPYGACINPVGKEGMFPETCGACLSIGSTVTISGKTVWICSTDPEPGKAYKGTNICAINCNDNYDNDQDGLADIEDPDCPVPAGLVLCGRKRDAPETVERETDPCTLCHLFLMFKRIVDFLTLYIIIPLGILMLVIGGTMLLTAAGDPGRISGAKKILTAAIIGLVIFFLAWVIVNTIIVFLTTGGLPISGQTGKIFLQSWNQINCPVGEAPLCP